jgi:hypothetical protein
LRAESKSAIVALSEGVAKLRTTTDDDDDDSSPIIVLKPSSASAPVLATPKLPARR